MQSILDTCKKNLENKFCLIKKKIDDLRLRENESERKSGSEIIKKYKNVYNSRQVK